MRARFWRLLDRLIGVRVITDQPDPKLQCPNPECHQSFIAWTQSEWYRGSYITQYWLGCPNYRTAPIGEMQRHWAMWKKSSWGTRTYVERTAK